MKKIAVVAFAFGIDWGILPNRRIAQIASQKARRLGARVFTQLDIRIEEGIKVKYTDEKPGYPPSTLRIAREAVKWARQHGFIKLWIVAAEPHLWRALRDTKEAVRETSGRTIGIQACRGIKKYPKNSWFCLDSAQKRTKSQKEWNKQDKILKLLPFWLYKHIAN